MLAPPHHAFRDKSAELPRLHQTPLRRDSAEEVVKCALVALARGHSLLEPHHALALDGNRWDVPRGPLGVGHPRVDIVDDPSIADDAQLRTKTLRLVLEEVDAILGRRGVPTGVWLGREEARRRASCLGRPPTLARRARHTCGISAPRTQRARRRERLATAR